MNRMLRGGLPLLAALALGCAGPENLTTASVSRSQHSDAVPDDARAATLAAILDGNEQSLIAAPALVPPGAPLAPFVEARLYAIANVAMHDALNGVVPRYERYADAGPVDRSASPVAAVLTAAHEAIAGALPGGSTGAVAAVNTWYAQRIGALAGAPGLAAGVAVGHRAAAAILARRASDGAAGGGVAPYTPGTQPGDYQFTFPFNTLDFNFFHTGGFADASQWAATVSTFVLANAAQFRAPRPYGAASNAQAVLTAHYTADYLEVQRLGCVGCSLRTPTQTEMALFWKESSPAGWNRVARAVITARHLGPAETARTLALLQLGEFDGYTSALEAKYFYNFWRPVTAVELAGSDGNAATAPTVGWQVLAFPTPPVPDYPSAHAVAGGVAAAVLEAMTPGRVAFSTTSASLPGVTRSFDSVAQAARENADSRVFIGYHFRHATDAGLAQGRAVGRSMVERALRPLDGDER